MKVILVITIFLMVIISSCCAQTFQYSRGWTNGKRSNSHLHEDTTLLPEIDSEWGKKLEKCLLNLQRIIHNTYGMSSFSVGATTGAKLSTSRHGLEGPPPRAVDMSSDDMTVAIDSNGNERFIRQTF